jgi:ribosomal protein S17E
MFWPILALMVILAITSIIFGMKLQTHFIVKEIREAAIDRYQASLTKNFEEAVKEAAEKLVIATYDQFEEKIKELVGEKNIDEVMLYIEQELEKENE